MMEKNDVGKQRMDSAKRFMYETFNANDEESMEELTIWWHLTIYLAGMEEEFNIDDRVKFESFIEEINCVASKDFAYFSKVFDTYFVEGVKSKDIPVEKVGTTSEDMHTETKSLTSNGQDGPKEYLKHFRNYQKFDRKGRRLSIFADVVGDVLRFYVFRCSKKDVFSKAKAIDMYNAWKNQSLDSWLTNAVHGTPICFAVIINDREKIKNLFIKVCNQKFCSAIPSSVVTSYKFLTGEDINR